MFRLRLIKKFAQYTDLNIYNSVKNVPIHNSCRLMATKINQKLPTNKDIQNSSNPNKSEQEFLVRLKNDPDLFGDAEPRIIANENELKEDKYFEDQPAPSQKLRTKQYADIIKNLIQQRKIKEALDVLEIRMLKEDRVQPENYIYNLLLGACGTVGYTKKAFSLYNEMKRRGLKVTGGTYTALFNACANSPWPEDGLTRAKHLREIMVEKMYEPNDTNYNAMIKAFGRCGDLPTAFSIIDEMIAKKIPTRNDTMNFVLQACISDKDAGFRHSLIVWRKMMIKRINPNFYTFNLMLRTIRDCGIGDVEVMQDTLNTVLRINPSKQKTSTKLLLESSEKGQLLVTTLLNNESSNNNLAVPENLWPNLMAKVPHLGSLISFSEVKKPEDRLLLVGGAKGFLETMDEHKCAPDIRTFTILLDCLPGSSAAEAELIKTMKKYNVKPDLDFFNMLIKKRSMRFDYDSAREVLEIMKKMGHKADLITYGVLALGCKTKEEACELIEEMKEHSYTINAEILGAMLAQACHHKNIPYINEIMNICVQEGIRPNKIFLNHLAEFKRICYKALNDKNHKLYQSTSFSKIFNSFKIRYKKWLTEIEVNDSENAHPWTQYRQTSETDTRHLKAKTPSKFKPRHISQFKVKTSPKHFENKK